MGLTDVTSRREMALTLTRAGKSIVPVGTDKRPLIAWQGYQTNIATAAEVDSWFNHNPDANLALVTGKISNVVVIDCDSDDANERFIAEFPEAKDTMTVKTPRGYHYYFQYEEGVRNDAGKKIGTGIDVRGDGGYVLCPPSVGSNGSHYQFLHPVRTIKLPETLRDKLVRGSNVHSGGHDSGHDGSPVGRDHQNRIGQGGRNNFLTRMAGTLRHHNVGLDGIIASLKKANEEQCEPPLPDSEVETIARSVSRYDSEAEYEPPVHVSHDLLTVSLSQVKREKVSWLWYQRIPLGLITLVEGDGGVCKSWFTMVIAAHVSTGRPLPGHEDNPIMGPVIIMSAEDSLGGVIKGRLEDAGADNSKITAVTGLRDEHGEKQVSLRDLPRIDQMCEEVHPKLLIVDPIVAYLGGNDMNHAGSVRGLLAPLHAMAERHQLSVILVRHLNKATDQAAKYRGQGSIDFYSACRSAFQVIPDSVNRNRRHVVHVKSNYGPLVPTQEFEIHNSVLQFGDTNFCSAEELYARLANAHKSNGSNSGGGTNSSYQGVL